MCSRVRSVARDGGFCVSDRDLRPGEDVPGPVRSGVPAAPGSGDDLGSYFHDCVDAIRYGQDPSAAGGIFLCVFVFFGQSPVFHRRGR